MTQQEPYVPYAAMKKRLALALVELERVKAENERLRAVHLHGCDCAPDDACAFARQRDEALAEVEQMRAEIVRLRASVHEPFGNRNHLHTSVHPRDRVAELEESVHLRAHINKSRGLEGEMNNKFDLEAAQDELDMALDSVCFDEADGVDGRAEWTQEYARLALAEIVRLRARVAELEEGAQPTSPDVTP